ncbi:MAG: hypothetical protein ACI8Y4_005566 [Candidatus Poriferisodalaceae bacterium]|jgi:hypothetical protein
MPTVRSRARSLQQTLTSTEGSEVVSVNGADLGGVTDIVEVNGGFRNGVLRNKIPNTSVVIDDPSAILIGLGDGTYANAWPTLEIESEGTSRGAETRELSQLEVPRSHGRVGLGVMPHWRFRSRVG